MKKNNRTVSPKTRNLSTTELGRTHGAGYSDYVDQRAGLSPTSLVSPDSLWGIISPNMRGI